MELYNAMERLKLMKESIIKPPRIRVVTILQSLSETLAAAPSKLGTSLEKSPPKYIEFVLKSVLNRHKNGHPRGVWNFHTPVWLFRSMFISNSRVYLIV